MINWRHLNKRRETAQQHPTKRTIAAWERAIDAAIPLVESRMDAQSLMMHGRACLDLRQSLRKENAA